MKKLKKNETIELNKREIHAIRALIMLNQNILEQSLDLGIKDINAELGFMAKILSRIGQIKLHIKLGIVEEQCEHDEHDHGVCLDCGEDITNNLVGEAEAKCEGDR